MNPVKAPSGIRLADAIAQNLVTAGGCLWVCPDCGQDFLRFDQARNPRCLVCRQARLRARWAERKSAWRQARSPVKEMACVHCGVLFTPKRSTAQFCGTACRVAAHRAKAKN